MLVVAVGMVEQAGDEVRRSAADRQAVGLHQRQHLARIPDVGEVDRGALQDGDEEGAEHADEVPDRGGGQLPSAVRRVVGQQLAGLEAQRLMAVDDALGVARGAGRERDQRGIRRVGCDGARHRLIVEEVVEIELDARPLGRADQHDDRHVPAQVGLVRHAAELLGGDEHAWLGGRQDVADLLASVEVHDRHHHRAEERRRPEGGRGLHPVRQLQRHHVARSDAALAQPRREPARGQLDVTEGARPRTLRGVDVEPRAGAGLEAARQEPAEGLLRPPTLLLVAFD